MLNKKLLKFNKTKRNFFIYGLGQAFNLLSPLIIAPFIISVCGTEGLGKAGLGFALSLFLILIVDYAFDVKATKQIAENRDFPNKLEQIINITLYTKAFLFVIVLLITLPVLFFVPFLNQEKTLYFFSISIVLAQIFNPVWFFQGIENFKAVSLLNIGSKSLYVILVFSFLINKMDYIYVNLFLGLSNLTFNISGLFFIKNKYDFKFLKPNFFEVKKILKNDFSFCASQLFLSARQLSPLVLAGYFLGFSFAGQYKVMEQVITLFRTFIQVYLKFFYPSVCYKFIVEKTTGFTFWKQYTFLNTLLVTLTLFAIFVFSASILSYFHLSAATIVLINPVFRLSLLVSLFMSLSLPLEQLMFIINKNKVYIKITMFVTLINIVLILILIRKFQFFGIIVPMLISEILFIVLYLNYAFFSLKKTIQYENNAQ